jgi:transcription elongation factor Elf1
MQYVPISVYDNYISAHIAMGRLEEDGINCWLKDENTVTIDPILTNAIGGIKLMVATTQAERAATILRDIEKQYKATITCPRCGSHNVELVSTPRKPANWIMAVFGFLSASYALSVEKVNHCFNCGNEFEPADLE